MKRTANLKYFIAAVVALITFIVYLPALQNEFVEWDDNQYVFENAHIRSINAPLFGWAFSAFYASNWHPLTWISHALDYAVWGLNPLGHHLTNNVLHAVNTFLVVLLIAKLISLRDAEVKSEIRNLKSGIPNPKLSRDDSSFTLIAAATTGLLFGLHPIHVESVAWVAERKDLLCALFFLLSVMSYVSYRSYKSHKIYLLTLGFFILALLSKPMSVSLPVVLLILDWHTFKRINSLKTFRTACIEKLPFLALSFISSVLTVLAQKSGGAMAFMETVPLSSRLLVAVRSLVAYLSNMLLPADLISYYPYPGHVPFPSAEYLVPLVVAAGMTVLSFIAFKSNRLWLSVWAYYVCTLIPVLGVVQVGSQAMADRYTYLPSIGPFLIAGLTAAWSADRMKRQGSFFIRAGMAAVVAVVLALSCLTVKQIALWKDSITLWSSVIEKMPDRAFFAYNNRGMAYSRSGEIDKAIADYYKAISIRPGYAATYSNLGIAYLKKGLPDQAIGNYQIAVRLRPGFADAHRNLAIALYMNGRVAEALEHYLVVTRLHPDDAGAQADLGSAYGAMGQYYKAIEHFESALRLHPDLAYVHRNLATAYSLTGRTDKAREHNERYLRLNPRDRESRDPIHAREMKAP